MSSTATNQEAYRYGLSIVTSPSSEKISPPTRTVPSGWAQTQLHPSSEEPPKHFCQTRAPPASSFKTQKSSPPWLPVTSPSVELETAAMRKEPSVRGTMPVMVSLPEPPNVFIHSRFPVASRRKSSRSWWVVKSGFCRQIWPPPMNPPSGRATRQRPSRLSEEAVPSTLLQTLAGNWKLFVEKGTRVVQGPAAPDRSLWRTRIQ